MEVKCHRKDDCLFVGYQEGIKFLSEFVTVVVDKKY